MRMGKQIKFSMKRKLQRKHENIMKKYPIKRNGNFSMKNKKYKFRAQKQMIKLTDFYYYFSRRKDDFVSIIFLIKLVQ